MRRSLTLLMTIIFILTLSAVIGFTLKTFGKTTAKTTHQFLMKQAQLLAHSATEYAIMAVQGHPPSSNCIEHVNINYNNTFDVNVTIKYFIDDTNFNCNSNNILSNTIQHKESNLTMLMYVDVTLNPNVQKNEPKFHYTTISLQKL